MTKIATVTSEVEQEHLEYLRRLHENPRISFYNRTRYVILIISIICLAWLMGNSLILNFTIICMTDDTCKGNDEACQITEQSGTRYHYTSSQESLLFSAIAIGSLIGTYPVVLLETKLSNRNLLTLFGFISGISTMLIPVSAAAGFWMLFLMRFLEGFALAANYPVLGAIESNWSPLKESGMYTAWLSCNLQFAAIFTMPVSGEFCVSSVGWEGVYYFQGILTLISFVVFYFIFRDTPRIHGFVSAKELKLIEDGKEEVPEKKVQAIPYGPIFRSLPIWGVWICCIGATMGYQIFVQYGPTYLNKVLNFKVTNTGFLTAIANMASCVVKILGGPVSDMATCVSVKNRVKLFTIASQGVMALSFVCLALVPSDWVVLAEIAYVAAVSFSGLMWVGAVKSGALVSQQHAHFVFAVVSLINSLGILLLPPFVQALAPDNSPEQWAVILYIICACVIVCTVLFAFVGEAEPAWWTHTESKNRLERDLSSFK